MDDASKKRLEQMKAHYPNVCLRVVGPKEYDQLQKHFGKLLYGWEFFKQVKHRQEQPTLFSEQGNNIEN
jgi:hypothetical protein